MPLCYWKGCVNPDDFPKQAELVARILNGEVKLDKIVNQPIYKARINQANRLLWTTVMVRGEPWMLILGLVLNHDYRKCKFLKPEVLRQFLQTDELALLQMETTSLVEAAEVHPKAVYYNQEFIVFNPTQEQALTLPTPIVVHGLPGTGKSSFEFQCLSQLRPAAEALGQANLFVAESEPVVDKFRQHWGPDPLTHTLSYDQVLMAQEPFCQLSNRVDNAHCKAWIQHHSKSHSLAAVDLFEEFRIVALYAQGLEPFTVNDYLNLGQRESLFINPEQRQKAWEAFKAYQHELKLLGLWHPAFFLSQAKACYHAVACDEASDLSLLQLYQLQQLSSESRIVYALDSNQRLQDRIAHRQSLVNLLYRVNGKAPSQQGLTHSYRCPKAVNQLANLVLKAINSLNDGLVDKQALSIGLTEKLGIA